MPKLLPWVDSFATEQILRDLTAAYFGLAAKVGSKSLNDGFAR